MKLLVIEDDRETAAYLVKGLSESGYTVDHSGDGREGLFLATSGSYDAIVLDRMLPGMDGLAILGELLPREFQLLEYLMRNAGHVVTRTMLLENVWDYHFDPQTNVIDVHVSRLRQKIDKQFEHPLLHTVRGAGYCLRAGA